MPEANYRLGKWCPLWLRGWVLHWRWSNDSPTTGADSTRIAGKIMLLWHYRGKRQKTYVYIAFSADGEMLSCGSALTLREAKSRTFDALISGGPATG